MTRRAFARHLATALVYALALGSTSARLVFAQAPTPADAASISTARPLEYVPPAYPPEAEAEGLEATVVLQLDVDKTGKVIRAVVVGPAGHGFDEAAVEAAKKIPFEPARKPDGTPVGARVLYRYVFALKPAAAPAPSKTAATKPETSALLGRVLTSAGDAPIAGARVRVVRIEEAAGGAVTDSAQRVVAESTTAEDGSFSLRDLPPGAYRVVVDAAGFRPNELSEALAAGEPIEVRYRLVAAGDLEVMVLGPRPPREVVKRTLERREISRIPGTNGDALRSIQNLPGVARPPGIAGLLIVRGSSPRDSQTFIDGTPVPIIYHFGGLSSVVPTEMLEKIDFYPGNFSVMFGRGQGGIVDAGLKSPTSDGKYHGLAQVDLIDVRGLLEGPVPFTKTWTFAIAARRSYFDAWLGPVLEAAGAGVTQAPVYYDGQLIAEHKPNAASSLRFALFGSDDSLKILIGEPTAGEPALAGNVGLHTGFWRIQARYALDQGDGGKVRALASFGNDSIDFGVGGFFFLLDVYRASARLEKTWRLGKRASFNAGLDVDSGHYDVALRLPPPPPPGQPPNQPFSTQPPRDVSVAGEFIFPAVYGEFELTPHERLRIVPGLRIDYINVTDRVDVSPRVSARLTLAKEFPRTTAKSGVGLFHQPPQFQEVVPPLGDPSLTTNRAIHYALGVEQELTRRVELSVEGFYKQLDEQVVSVTQATSADRRFRNSGEGSVVGGEVLLRYKPDERFFGWAAYTLSRSTRRDSPSGEPYLVPFDQTHILTVLGSYRLGGGWELGARFRLVSGNLITPNVCKVTEPGCDPNRTNGLFHAPSGTYTPLPVGARASERLPLFHQLDVRLDKRWKFKAWQLSAYLDVQNAYNHANVEGVGYNFNYTQRQNVTGIPILPSIGLRGEF